jgi:hypothetical protein
MQVMLLVTGLAVLEFQQGCVAKMRQVKISKKKKLEELKHDIEMVLSFVFKSFHGVKF